MAPSQSTPDGLDGAAKGFIQVCVWLWFLWLVAAPILAAKDAPEHALFPAVLLGLPSAGLLLVAFGVRLWSVGEKAHEQERQLGHLRHLAGVQGIIGAAVMATIGIFESGELEMSMFTSSVMWLAGAVIYFVAFWGLVRLEAL